MSLPFDADAGNNYSLNNLSKAMKEGQKVRHNLTGEVMEVKKYYGEEVVSCYREEIIYNSMREKVMAVAVCLTKNLTLVES